LEGFTEIVDHSTAAYDTILMHNEISNADVLTWLTSGFTLRCNFLDLSLE